MINISLSSCTLTTMELELSLEGNYVRYLLISIRSVQAGSDYP